eukprot:scaffold33238_cov18-Tisochrysis_lutea.AAC.1
MADMLLAHSQTDWRALLWLWMSSMIDASRAEERAERLRELQKEEQLARMARAKETRQIARSIQ